MRSNPTNNPKRNVRGDPAAKFIRAFTLVELLVVIAIIAILMALTLTSVSRVKQKAHATQCVNGIRQIAMAFALYHGDNQDIFPTGASRRTYGPQPEDWIWWQKDRDIEGSTLAPYLAGISRQLFLCPADKRRNLDPPPRSRSDPYRYSYSLNGYDLEHRPGDEEAEAGRNPGMASIATNSTPRAFYPFPATAIRNPSVKIMLAEEAPNVIDDGRWIPNFPSFNRLAERHSGGANVAFADTHVERVDLWFGTNAANSLASW
jgi:prepilin-type N-terminal cleavage/methylation domain-containing protein/prepilin-type processing-associated H-X9-DG protein